MVSLEATTNKSIAPVAGDDAAGFTSWSGRLCCVSFSRCLESMESHNSMEKAESMIVCITCDLQKWVSVSRAIPLDILVRGGARRAESVGAVSIRCLVGHKEERAIVCSVRWCLAVRRSFFANTSLRVSRRLVFSLLA